MSYIMLTSRKSRQTATILMEWTGCSNKHNCD